MADKVTKSSAFRSECEAGNVAIVRSTGENGWNGKLIDMLCAFVGDDEDEDTFVDCCAIAYNSLTIQGGKGQSVIWGEE